MSENDDEAKKALAERMKKLAASQYKAAGARGTIVNRTMGLTTTPEFELRKGKEGETVNEQLQRVVREREESAAASGKFNKAIKETDAKREERDAEHRKPKA